jgi:hypothetical protein
MGGGVILEYNADILDCDFVVDVPVLKTHAQTMVSLGIKNLKGVISEKSRKKCHNAEPGRDLNYHVSKLANKLPPSMAILDGIYTNERGPSFDGRIRRSDILIASPDILSADMVGASVLGYEPSTVPHLAYAAADRGRPADLGDVEVVGETIEAVAASHEFDFQYTPENTMPMALAKRGIEGIAYRKYDLTMCSYCSGINGTVLSAIAQSYKGEPWDDVEILTGKAMKPEQGRKKTILLGKCMYQANKGNPDIQEMIAIKGCPPKAKDLLKAFKQAGIELNPAIFDNMEMAPGFFMKRYEDKPEFEEAFFQVK